MRGVAPELIPAMVLSNLKSRFQNMEQSIMSIPELYNQQQQRYTTTSQFFRDWSFHQKNTKEYTTFVALIQSIVVEQKLGWKTLAEAFKNQQWGLLQPAINGIVEEMRG